MDNLWITSLILGRTVERGSRDCYGGGEALGKNCGGLWFVAALSRPFALSGAWGEPSLEGCESGGPDRLSLSQVRFRPRPIARLARRIGEQTGSSSMSSPVLALAGRAVTDQIGCVAVPLGALVVRRPTAERDMQPRSRRGHRRGVVRTWRSPLREPVLSSIIGGVVVDVKRPGALKEILGLADELSDKMAGLLMRVTVEADPRGESRLLEQWGAAHQAVNQAQGELSRLADAVAAATAYTVSVG